MSTLSVPLTRNLEDIVNSFVKKGYASNKAEVMRKALVFLAEEEAIQEVLKAEKELLEGKILRGDIRKIMSKMP